MAPSPQERKVLQAASTNVIVAPVSQNTTTTTTSNTMSNNNNNNNTKHAKHPRTVVMMRTASQSTDDGDSQYKRTADSSRSSLSLLDEEEALAVASARMGENVYDSPNAVPRKIMDEKSFSKHISSSSDDDDDYKDHHDNNNQIRMTRMKNHGSSSSNNKHHHAMDTPADEYAAASAGILASGLAWVQRSRESRRRKYLQHQAEQQLRKIREAECKVPFDNHHSTTTCGANPTFLQMRNYDGSSHQNRNNTNHGNSSSTDIDIIRVSPPRLSKSGEGASAHLDWGDLQEDEYSIPKVRVADGSGGSESPYILTPDQMHQVAIHVLPKSVAYNRWKRIYGLGRDGDSFDGCLRLIEGVSRTLMVVRTTKGEVFGGYADSPWHSQAQKQSQFYGGAGACLFSLVGGDNNNGNGNNNGNNNNNNNPTRVKVFNWTGKNRYIQLCDVSRKMLAFGGGGEDGVFGLAVEEDFQKGSTGPCDTFDNVQLCSEEIFAIVDLEFWEFPSGMF
mmetsp:Transcript_74803/g.112757  ORF Transcript_74803/g.112757 Transcript_74803/m.112757 type:complete len:504 (+) Transcript_74803:56-1567(+)